MIKINGLYSRYKRDESEFVFKMFLNGGISLTARTVDCDSTNAGSTPVYHPIKKWRGSLKKKILSKTFSGNSSKLFSFIEG